jgi:hypothetical protein
MLLHKSDGTKCRALARHHPLFARLFVGMRWQVLTACTRFERVGCERRKERLAKHKSLRDTLEEKERLVLFGLRSPLQGTWLESAVVSLQALL